MSDPAADPLGTVRRKPSGTSLAICWPAHDADRWRWTVTDHWGPTGYQRDAAVADWPVIGAVPGSPADTGQPLPKPS